MEDFEHVFDICKEGYQISKISSEKYDIICVYRSTDQGKENQINLLFDLNTLIKVNRKTFILGDFNFDALEANLILNELHNWDFIQLVKEPTHILGGLIDHCYLSDNINPETVIVSQKSVYYTDHDVTKVIIVISPSSVQV